MRLVYNDLSHSYWLDGKRVKSASKVAGIAADDFTVQQWGKRQIAIGMTLDPTLSERVAVDLDNREAIQQVCDDAANAAKANARAQRGTQRHRAFELLLLGKQNMFVTDQQKTDGEVLERTLDRYGLEPIPDRVEQFVAWPEHGVVGRYDAYLQYRGEPVLVDLKGGHNAVKYPHSTAVQLWLYRFAPHTSATVERDGDKSTVEEWTIAPEDADDQFAYVIYCDDHHDVGELWAIDLTDAETGGRAALRIVDWRKMYNYGRDLARQVAAPVFHPVEQRSGVGVPQAAPTPDKPDEEAVSHMRIIRREQLRERYQAMSDPEKLAYCALKVDPNDLDAVEAGLDHVDRFNIRIEAPPAPALTIVPNLPKPPDEGGRVIQVDVAALNDRFDRLDVAAQLWTGTLVAQSKQSHDFRIKDRPTVRRYELYRGILALAEWGQGHDQLDDIIRAIYALIRNDETATWPETRPGRLLAELDAEQAQQFATIAQQVAGDKFALTYNEDGPPTLTPAA